MFTATRKGWHYKARVSQDILTGKWTQATRRGFASAVDASTARRELLEGNQAVVVGSGSMSVNELMKLYFEDAESSSALSTKTLFDYRNYADVYVSPYLGGRAIRDITPEMIARWQQKLTKGGAIRSGKPLSSNSVPRSCSSGRRVQVRGSPCAYSQEPDGKRATTEATSFDC